MASKPLNVSSLGADLRALRKARGFTLQELSERMDRSVGWLSQVERDKSNPSVADLKIIAAELDVSLSTLFRHEEAPSNETGYVVRRSARRPIGSRVAGLVEELLSPDLTDDFEMLISTFEPGARLTEPTQRDTQEVGYMISGRLNLQVGDRSFTVQKGDSFRVRGEPFLWMNPYDEPAVAVWVIAPPVY